jgi:hypothetical protein
MRLGGMPHWFVALMDPTRAIVIAAQLPVTQFRLVVFEYRYQRSLAPPAMLEQPSPTRVSDQYPGDSLHDGTMAESWNPSRANRASRDLAPTPPGRSC